MYPKWDTPFFIIEADTGVISGNIKRKEVLIWAIFQEQVRIVLTL